jgi:hypothetical protein
VRPTQIDCLLRDLAASRHGALSLVEAEGAGISAKALRNRLRAGLLAEPAPGVLVVTAVPASWRQRLAVATLAGGGSVASHRAAAALHLPGVIDDPPVEVTVDRSRRASAPGAVVHRSSILEEDDVMEVDGIPVTTLAVTLASIGSVAPELLEPCLDAARRAKVSLRWLRTTATRLHRPGQRGTGLLLDLLDEIQPGEGVRDSWFEKLVEGVLRSPLLPPLVRQHEVRDRAGRLVARLDAAFPCVKLGVEAHSRAFHFGSGPETADERRDLALAGVGWEVAYLGWHRTRSSPDEIVREVFAAAVARGWDPVTQTAAMPPPTH